MPELEIVKPVGSNKTLIRETENSKLDTPKYYIADSGKVDKFIKSRKKLDSMNGLQKFLSGIMAITGGILVGRSLKTLPIVGGIVSALAIYGVCDVLDKYIDKKTKQISMKKHSVKEVHFSEVV